VSLVSDGTSSKPLRQYAALHIPADASLGPYLADVQGLARRRSGQIEGWSRGSSSSERQERETVMTVVQE
jgi:hypothetical protein